MLGGGTNYLATMPEITIYMVLLVFAAGSAKPVINNDTSPPAAFAVVKASKPAIGTPIKFTRSLPAKANANANVPDKIVIRKIFTRNSCKKKRNNEQHTHAIANETSKCSSTHATNAVPPSCDFKPLNRAK